MASQSNPGPALSTAARKLYEPIHPCKQKRSPVRKGGLSEVVAQLKSKISNLEAKLELAELTSDESVAEMVQIMFQ